MSAVQIWKTLSFLMAWLSVFLFIEESLCLWVSPFVIMIGAVKWGLESFAVGSLVECIVKSLGLCSSYVILQSIQPLFPIPIINSRCRRLMNILKRLHILKRSRNFRFLLIILRFTTFISRIEITKSLTVPFLALIKILDTLSLILGFAS